MLPRCRTCYRASHLPALFHPFFAHDFLGLTPCSTRRIYQTRSFRWSIGPYRSKVSRPLTPEKILLDGWRFPVLLGEGVPHGILACRVLGVEHRLVEVLMDPGYRNHHWLSPPSPYHLMHPIHILVAVAFRNPTRIPGGVVRQFTRAFRNHQTSLIRVFSFPSRLSLLLVRSYTIRDTAGDCLLIFDVSTLLPLRPGV